MCEVFSSPNLCERARRRGLKGGWSLDLSSEDPISQRTWDLSKKAEVSRVRGMLRRDRPELLVLTPPSHEKIREVDALFEAAVELSVLQAQLGGVFMLEHPRRSRAWKTASMQKLRNVPGILGVTCTRGRAKVLTNSRSIAEKLDGLEPQTRIATYVESGGEAILDGLCVHREWTSRTRWEEILELQDMCDPADVVWQQTQEGGEEWLKYKENSGSTHHAPPRGREEEEMNKANIKEWRKTEVSVFHQIGVYKYATRQEMKATPGAKLVDTTWVDDPQKRKSRLCAREFAGDEKRDDLFAPTPSLTATRLVVSECASGQDKNL